MSLFFNGSPHSNGKSSLVTNQLHIINQLKQKYVSSSIAEDTELSPLISLENSQLPDLQIHKQNAINYSPNSRHLQPSIRVFKQDDDIIKPSETKKSNFTIRYQSPQPIKLSKQQQVTQVKSQINSKDNVKEQQSYKSKILFQQQYKLNTIQDNLVSKDDSSIPFQVKQINNQCMSSATSINNFSQKNLQHITEPSLQTVREFSSSQNVSIRPKANTIGIIKSQESPLSQIEEKQDRNFQQKFQNEIKEFSNKWESSELNQTKIEIFLNLLKTLIVEVKRLQPVRQICLQAIELLDDNLFCKNSFLLNLFSESFQEQKNIRESSYQAAGADDSESFHESDKIQCSANRNKCDQRLYSSLFNQIQQDHQQAVQYYQNSVVSLKYQVDDGVRLKLELESVIQNLQSRVKITLMKNKELQHYIKLAEQMNQNNQTNIKNILDQQQNQINQMEKGHKDQVKGLQNQIIQLIKQSVEDSKSIVAQQLQQVTTDDSRESIISQNKATILVAQQQKIQDLECINLELSSKNNQLLFTIDDLSSQIGFLKEKTTLMQQQIDFFKSNEYKQIQTTEYMTVGYNQTLGKKNDNNLRKKKVNIQSSPRQQNQEMVEDKPLEQLN